MEQQADSPASSTTRIIPVLRRTSIVSGPSVVPSPVDQQSLAGGSIGGSARGSVRGGGSDDGGLGGQEEGLESLGNAVGPSQDSPLSPPSRPKLTPSAPGSAGSVSSFEGLPSPQHWEFTTTSPFTYSPTDEQDGDQGEHYILTGRAGAFTRCEDEPIHAPGAVQAFGCLLALDQQEDGSCKVQQVSENSASILGLSPHQLLSVDSLAFPDHLEDITDALFLYDSAGQARPTPFSTSFTGPDGVERECSCHVHRPSPRLQPRRVILEVEPIDTEYHSSTTRSEYSTSLLHEMQRYTRRRERGAKAEIDAMRLVSEVQDKLAMPSDMEELWETVAQIFKQVAGFARVMVYEFDESWNGHVVAEEGGGGPTDYRGLVWSASDIPPQARELYRINKARLLYDRDEPTARMCCRSQEEVDNPLDMTHCHLRAISPIHIKYLGNMGVRSSMSISISAFGKLHALVAMHEYDEARRPPPRIRDLCTLISDSVNVNLERLLLKLRLEARQVVSPEITSGSVVATPVDLLEIMQADFACLSIGGSNKLLGNIENSAELLAIINFVRRQASNLVISTHHLEADFPELARSYSPSFTELAGFLSIPLSHGSTDLIVFARKCQTKEIHWAGNPHAPTAGRLEPRTSFKLWREIVQGQCKPWTEVNHEEATRIGWCYGCLIRLARESEDATAKNRLREVLLAASSHMARSPLNAIIGHLELALQSDLSPELRDLLNTSRTASRSLTYVVNDLLDLTTLEPSAQPSTGRIEETFDLAELLADTMAVHHDEAQRKGLNFELYPTSEGAALPDLVGDVGQLRKAVSFIAENAVKYTQRGGITVEYGLDEVLMVEGDEEGGEELDVAIKITDTGVGMSQNVLEGIFRQLEGVDERAELEEGHSIGLGLAVTSRITRLLGGQIKISSTPGRGTEFTLVVPLRVAGVPPSAESAPRAPSPSVDLDRIVLAISKSHLAPPPSSQPAAPPSPTCSPSSTAPPLPQSPPAPKAHRPRPTPIARSSTHPHHHDTAPEVPLSPTRAGSSRPSLASLSRSASSPFPHERSLMSDDDSGDLSPLRVLVVEDNPLMSSILKRLLARDGHDVEVCEHGGQALRLLEEDGEFDLVLMDLQMPYVDGFETTKAIRQREESLSFTHNARPSTHINGRLTILCCSAQLEAHQLPQLLKVGFDGFVNKPVYFETLRSMLGGVLDVRKREKCLIKSSTRPSKWSRGGWLKPAQDI